MSGPAPAARVLFSDIDGAAPPAKGPSPDHNGQLCHCDSGHRAPAPRSGTLVHYLKHLAHLGALLESPSGPSVFHYKARGHASRTGPPAGVRNAAFCTRPNRCEVHAPTGRALRQGRSAAGAVADGRGGIHLEALARARQGLPGAFPAKLLRPGVGRSGPPSTDFLPLRDTCHKSTAGRCRLRSP